jgi:hypothetical protein
LAIAAVGGVMGWAIPRLLDFWLAIAKEKRDFKRFRWEKAYAEIEELKNAIGPLYELAANWKPYDSKLEQYHKAFTNDHELIGKFNKFPELAAAARDLVHWCKIAASSEMEISQDLINNKKELQQKQRAFLQACDAQLEKLR